MERRAVLQILGLSALAVGGLTACSTPSSTTGGSTPTTRPGLRIPLSSIPVGGGIIRPDDEVVVTQATPGEYQAFSAVCQHQGCLVDSVEGKDIVCSCHGSRYSIVDGSVVNGPTTEPLIPATSVSTEGTDLIVVK